jgi:hypothetical protein
LVIDHSTGAVLHEFGVDVPGGVDVVDTGFGPVVDYQSYVLGIVDSSGKLSTHSLPAVAAGSSGVPTVLGLGDRLLAYTPFWFAQDRNGMNVWSSTDGYDWVDLGAPEFLPGGGDGAVVVFKRDGRLFADVFQADNEERWASVDGLNWSLIPAPPGARPTSVLAFREGFIASNDDGLTFRLWLSVDGVTWQEMDLDGLDIRSSVGGDFSGGFGAAVVGDVLFVISSDDSVGGFDELWTFELVGIPPDGDRP